MSDESNWLSDLIKLIKGANIESLTRWTATVYIFITPGYLYLYSFQYKEFNDLSTVKLLVLSFVLSVPIVYICYLLVGNYFRLEARKKPMDQANLRVRSLLNITILIVILDIVIFILGIRHKF